MTAAETIVIFIVAIFIGLVIGVTAAYEGVTNDCKQLEKYRWAGVVYECRRIGGAAK